MSLHDMSGKQAVFFEQIMGLPVFDTHTHLIGDRLGARDFWEIAHYFWFYRELQAGGYPDEADKLPEAERIAAFLKAYQSTRSTLMNWVFTSIMRELYGVIIKDEHSVQEAMARVRQASAEEGWAQQTADRMNIRRFVVNHPEHATFQGMRDDAVLLPGLTGCWVHGLTAWCILMIRPGLFWM